MPPSPVQFFLGRTITAREESTQDVPLFAISPQPGHAFEEPRGTHALYLPLETLVSVAARRLGAWAEPSSSGISPESVGLHWCFCGRSIPRTRRG